MVGVWMLNILWSFEHDVGLSIQHWTKCSVQNRVQYGDGPMGPDAARVNTNLLRELELS